MMLFFCSQRRGRAFGGWALYMKDGKIHYDYNYFGVDHTNIAGPEPIAAGKHTFKYEFKIDSPKPGTGGTSTLFVDGKKIAEGHVPKTQPFSFSTDEGADVGVDNKPQSLATTNR
jgi:hypothetical protein